MFKHLIVLIVVGAAFTPWKVTQRGGSVTVVFPEMGVTCIYGSCKVNPPNKEISGKDKCIVSDSNSARIVVNRVYFNCQEFVGKTIIWRNGTDKLIGTITNAQKTY